MAAAAAALDKVYSLIDSLAPAYISQLAEVVAIRSVSSDPSRRDDTIRVVEYAKSKFESIGVHCELKDIGTQKQHDGSEIPLPPVLFGTLKTGNDDRKTLLVYGHLDVQPAAKEDGWNTDPFELVEKDEKLYGRGSTDDKGPIFGWLHAIKALQESGVEIPVNIKFCLEAMEESGSEGLEPLLKREKDGFLKDVDLTIITDNYWISGHRPCITYGLRGISHYEVEVQGVKQDLHSGTFGGSVHEPLADLIWVLGQLTDVSGQILVPGIYGQVLPLSDDEQSLYEKLDFDLEGYRASLDAPKLVSDSKAKILMNRWRFPSLSLHGIEGAFSGKGSKTVIPAKVIGKFSIRLVPHMQPSDVDALVLAYLEKLWSQRGSPNHFRPKALHGALSWISDVKHPNYQAAARAIKAVWNVDPDYTREGASIPITLTFQELTGKNVLLLPLGAGDDMAHSQNEKLNKVNYINGIKVLATYLTELRNV